MSETLLMAFIAALYAPLTYPAVATLPSLAPSTANAYLGDALAVTASSVCIVVLTPCAVRPVGLPVTISPVAAFAANGNTANAAITDMFKIFFILFLLVCF